MQAIEATNHAFVSYCKLIDGAIEESRDAFMHSLQMNPLAVLHLSSHAYW